MHKILAFSWNLPSYSYLKWHIRLNFFVLLSQDIRAVLTND